MSKLRLRDAIECGIVPPPSKGRISSQNARSISILALDIRTGAELPFPETLSRLTSTLDNARVDWGVGGALALGLYIANPRSTSDIDVVLPFYERAKALEAMRGAGFSIKKISDEHFTTPQTPELVSVDLLFGHGDSEESGAETAQTAVLFGVRTKVLKPEFLMWMLLLSDRGQHGPDRANLLKSKKVNIPNLMEYLDYSEDDRSKKVLLALQKRLKTFKERTYSQVQQERKRTMGSAPRIHKHFHFP